ncbi:MAG: LacI family DNA-binding transcriptional regulator [Capsulimonadaceae bacterium]
MASMDHDPFDRVVVGRPRATLKDVARQVGVSVTTASKVLNHTMSSGGVSESTRHRIEETARELGYQANSLARSLVRQRADTIAFFFDHHLNLNEPFSAALIEGAEEGCQARDQALLIYARRPGQTEDDVCGKLQSGMVDGVAFSGWTPRSIVARLRASGMPVVQYAYRDEVMPSVVVDEEAGGEITMAYLASRGHRHVLYRTSPGVGPLRIECHRCAAHRHGLSLSVVEAANTVGDFTPEEIAILARPRSERPTAVVCWNDEFAYRVLDHCDATGVHVPEDLAVIGFDGAATFPTPRHRLTTVFAPWVEMARTAVSLLVDLRDGHEIARETVLPVELRVGETA